MRVEVDVVVASGDLLGEGVIWALEPRRVWWTDILGRRLCRYDPSTGHYETFALEEQLASFAPLGGERLLAGFGSGLALMDLSDRSRRDLAPVEAHLPSTRLNDGKLDRQGRFVFGTMDENTEGAKPIGSVYSYDGSGTPRELFHGIRISNSIAFSPDGQKMFFADTPNRRIDICDYDPESGQVGPLRPFVSISESEGYPDGSAVDAEGCLWNAEWGGGRVVRYTPTGRIDRWIALPCRNITCCAFGGRDLRTLYVTTARYGLTSEQLASEPDAGSLFAMEVGVAGLPDTRFAGVGKWS